MTQQTVNYRIIHTPVNITLLNQEISKSITQWLPVLNNPSKELIKHIEFKLNNPFLSGKSNINNTKDINNKPTLQTGGFVSINQVVSVILAQEKHKVVRNEITEGTYRMTKVRLETHITDYFSHTDLRSINMGSIQGFIDFLSDQDLSTPTIVGYIAQLRKVLRYLVEQEHIAQMPLFPKMKVTQKPRGAFTVTEYGALLRQSKTLRHHVFHWDKPDTRFHIKPEYRRMPLEMNWLIRFMVYTFLRPGDVRQLKNKHIEIISGKFNYLRLTPPEIKRHKLNRPGF